VNCRLIQIHFFVSLGLEDKKVESLHNDVELEPDQYKRIENFFYIEEKYSIHGITVMYCKENENFFF
jgi:hypothetical protein